jgi:hypothetical protein
MRQVSTRVVLWIGLTVLSLASACDYGPKAMCLGIVEPCDSPPDSTHASQILGEP